MSGSKPVSHFMVPIPYPLCMNFEAKRVSNQNKLLSRISFGAKRVSNQNKKRHRTAMSEKYLDEM